MSVAVGVSMAHARGSDSDTSDDRRVIPALVEALAGVPLDTAFAHALRKLAGGLEGRAPNDRGSGRRAIPWFSEIISSIPGRTSR